MVESNNRMRQSLFTGVPWVVGCRALAAICGVASNAMLARLLDPAELGTYFLALSLAAVGTVLAQVGMAQTGLRLCAAERGAGRPEGAWQVVRSSLGWTGVGSMAMMLLFCAVGVWMGAGIALAFMVALLAGVQAFQGVTVELVRGYDRIGAASLNSGPVNSLFFVCLLAFCWFAGVGVNVVLLLGCTIAASGISVLLAGRSLSHVGLPAGAQDFRRNSAFTESLLPAALPLLVSNLVIIGLAQADVWVLARLLPRADVALYGAASRLALMISLPLTVVNSTITPVMAEYHARGETRAIEQSLRRIATVASIPSLMLLALFAVAGKPILGLLYGEFYRQGYPLLLMIGAGQVVCVLTGSCGSILTMGGRQRALMIITVSNGILTAAAAVLLARVYGVTGVAGAMAAGIIAQNLLMLLVARRATGIWTHARLSVWKI